MPRFDAKPLLDYTYPCLSAQTIQVMLPKRIQEGLLSMTAESTFKLTYATMFNPPEELHTSFEAALDKLRGNLGQEHAMIINGKDVFADEKFEDRNPANTAEIVGLFVRGCGEPEVDVPGDTGYSFRLGLSIERHQVIV